MRDRSKRRSEIAAHEINDQLDRQRELARLQTEVKSGYAGMAVLPLLGFHLCLRCSSLIYGQNRHDAWHDKMEMNR